MIPVRRRPVRNNRASEIPLRRCRAANYTSKRLCYCLCKRTVIAEDSQLDVAFPSRIPKLTSSKRWCSYANAVALENATCSRCSLFLPGNLHRPVPRMVFIRRNFVLANSGHGLVRPLVGFCYLVAGFGNLQLVDRVSALLNAPDVAWPPMIYAGSSARDSLKRFPHVHLLDCCRRSRSAQPKPLI